MLDVKKREMVASIDGVGWLALHVIEPGKLGKHRQREATRGNDP